MNAKLMRKTRNASSRYSIRIAVVEVLKKERRRQGLSQRALSRRLGKYDGYIRAIETLRRAVSAEEFILIAQALGRRSSRLMDQAFRKSKEKKS